MCYTAWKIALLGKEVTRGAGNVAQPEKFLLVKREDLSSDSQNRHFGVGGPEGHGNAGL